jgi:hypothetical protein
MPIAQSVHKSEHFLLNLRGSTTRSLFLKIEGAVVNVEQIQGSSCFVVQDAHKQKCAIVISETYDEFQVHT